MNSESWENWWGMVLCGLGFNEVAGQTTTENPENGLSLLAHGWGENEPTMVVS